MERQRHVLCLVKFTATVAWTVAGIALASLSAVTIPASADGKGHHKTPRHGRRVAAAGGCPDADTPANRASTQAMRDATLCLVNNVRATHRLPILHELHRLDNAAQGWSDAMVSKDFFSHTGSGSDPGSRVRAAGFPWSAVGENIASGYPTPRQVVSAWLSSTDHCHNILDPNYSYVGTGVNRNPIGGFASGPATWTQDFGLPAGAAPPSRNRGPSNGCPY